jgi:predicted nucleic acid-binding protein
MLAVSNTSPLSNLAILDRLYLLREQFNSVIIPHAVRLELDRLPHVAARQRLDSAIKEGWLCVTPLSDPVPVDVAFGLDPGEAEALALALQLNASMVLLDESAARARAHKIHLPHTGVLGVLRHARLTGRIVSLKFEILRLRTDARFFVAPALEKALLVSVGEG